MHLLDTGAVDRARLTGHREVTDAHVLALAVRRAQRLATMDRGIRLAAVRGATAHHLCLVPPVA